MPSQTSDQNLYVGHYKISGDSSSPIRPSEGQDVSTLGGTESNELDSSESSFMNLLSGFGAPVGDNRSDQGNSKRRQLEHDEDFSFVTNSCYAMPTDLSLNLMGSSFNAPVEGANTYQNGVVKPQGSNSKKLFGIPIIMNHASPDQSPDQLKVTEPGEQKKQIKNRSKGSGLIRSCTKVIIQLNFI